MNENDILCPMTFTLLLKEQMAEAIGCIQERCVCVWWDADCGKCGLCVIAEYMRKAARK